MKAWFRICSSNKEEFDTKYKTSLSLGVNVRDGVAQHFGAALCQRDEYVMHEFVDLAERHAADTDFARNSDKLRPRNSSREPEGLSLTRTPLPPLEHVFSIFSVSQIDLAAAFGCSVITSDVEGRQEICVCCCCSRPFVDFPVRSRRRPGAAPMTPPGEPKPAGPPIDMAVADTRWLSLFLLYCQLLLIGLLFFCSVMCDVHCLSLTGWMACA